MKKLVLSLKRREDRREHFVENTNLTNWEFFDAIDGNSYDLTRLQAEGFSTYKPYRDPVLNRKLTKGEIGCYLSHRLVWQKCIDLNEPIFVLEDDAVEILKYNEKYCKALTEHYDLIYLNRNEQRPNEVTELNFFLETPVYPYNASSYIITPKGAKTLIQNSRHQNIIPVDEHMCILMSELKACAFKKNVFNQASRKNLSSDIEGNEKDMWFIDFETYRFSPSKGLEALKEHLYSLDEDDVVFYSDKEVDLENTVKTYLQFRKRVLFGEDYMMGVVKEVLSILETYGVDESVFTQSLEENSHNIILEPNLC